MPGIFDRLKMIFGAKADAALDRLEDPRETLDYSYQRQLELLQQVRKGVAEVATSRKRLELQVGALNQQIDKYTDAARQALAMNREDLAREALTRKAGLQAQLGDLQGQYAQLQAEEEKLIRASQQLQSRVDAFRTKKETIKATYSAAEAQAKIGDAYAGLGREMGDIGLAIERAEDKTQQLQARAGAVDELLSSGALADPLSTGSDDITRELNALASTAQVDNELEQLKRSLGQLEPGAPTQATPQLPAGQWQQPKNSPAAGESGAASQSEAPSA
ncbi:PspA/IM30 family protein [Propioniciclava tarda]|uniref:PspA/IM30 family protein n=1 Tax=Propioniciclava tarda TaxID=433330 RepID=A0A4Q9KJT8_PROTD|nr:PspA/IM30 family protein [Propioniciclava tarda]TBT94703.1 PspA/IM30 family protein [Propioniciclava tarda]SMO65568.1 phage shock protein A (PspA) family protein [Propioniciclava tarda]